MNKETKRIMKHVITPLNEGQEMNCHVKVVSAISEAVKKAFGIAASLQAQLDGNTITCRVRQAGRERKHIGRETAPPCPPKED